METGTRLLQQRPCSEINGFWLRGAVRRFGCERSRRFARAICKTNGNERRPKHERENVEGQGTGTAEIGKRRGAMADGKTGKGVTNGRKRYLSSSLTCSSGGLCSTPLLSLVPLVCCSFGCSSDIMFIVRLLRIWFFNAVADWCACSTRVRWLAGEFVFIFDKRGQRVQVT